MTQYRKYPLRVVCRETLSTTETLKVQVQRLGAKDNVDNTAEYVLKAQVPPRWEGFLKNDEMTWRIKGSEMEVINPEGLDRITPQSSSSRDGRRAWCLG
jgi:hypothetical protein